MTDTLVDTGTRYCEIADVEDYVRNQSFGANTAPTLTRVNTLIDKASNKIDRRTNRAWRIRKVEGRDFTVEFDAAIESQFRRNFRRSSKHGLVQNTAYWGKVFVPHMDVKDFDSAQGDEIVVLQPQGTNDITADGGTREDSEWYVNNRTGIIEVDASQFIRGPIGHGGSSLVRDPRVKLTYRYGDDSSLTNSVPDELPADVQDACAKMVAADLMSTDTFGEVLPATENIDPQQAAETLREDAMATIEHYKQTHLM